MDERPVLVMSAVGDSTADLVTAELNARAVPVARVDPGDFGRGLSFTTSVTSGDLVEPGAGDPVAGTLATPSRMVDLGRVRSIYWRRPEWPKFSDLPGPDATWARAQMRHGFGGALMSLSGCVAVNDPMAEEAADYKPLQVAVAAKLGFTVPPTLVSNRRADIEEFIAAHRQVVHKTLRWTDYRRGDESLSVWTEPVTIDEIDDTVALVPHLFQARVDKVADLRVTVVGERVFGVRIDSDLLDWRRDYGSLSYTVIDLPDRVVKMLRTYLEHFRLAFGCFDMCVDANDDYHWLELNPNGEWGWIAAETGLPIAAAFADLLQGAS